MNSNKLLYIGLNGLAGSGKDTVAKMLKVILLKNWDNIDDVINAGKELAKNPNIKNVVIHNARDYNGNKTDGYGLWIKWVNTIDDTGLKYDVTPQSPTMPIKIK